jgi:hypothetical protein
MTQIEFEEEALLQTARRAMAPAVTDRARVRLSLLSALSAPVVIAETAGDVPNASAPPTRAVAAGSALGKALRFALFGAVFAGAGFGAGYWQASQPQAKRSALVVALPALSATAQVVPNAAEALPDAPQSETPTTAKANPVTPRGSVAVVPSHGSPPVVLPEAALDEEVRTLRRAERAVRERNPRLALVLLEELSQTSKGGRLLEERDAESIVARCMLEPNGAAALGQAFEQAHPESVYLDRVRQSCRIGGHE